MRRLVAGLVLALGTILPAAAHAQDAAGAEVLFQKARQLFDQKKYAEACPKFAESYRLDPLTGALLALASCHEAEGKLASAWVEYLDVATRARREGKNDRADAAQQRAATLEPKLARLTIAPAPGAEAITDLVVKRDGVVVGAGTFGTALPVDKGEHTVEASAPGRQPFSRRVTMQDGAAETVSIPVLEGAAPVELPQQQGENHPMPVGPPKGGGGFPLKTVGLVTAGVGVVVIGIGGYFGVSAIGKNSDSNSTGCNASTNVCTGRGLANRRDAVDAGNTSTALFVVGGLVTAAGIAMFVLAKPSPSTSAKARPSLAAAPAIAPGTAGLALSGSF
ncbi:MAG TPA: hypothetical protein VLT33_45240 [Labilithrix sp.]|nr:hypothetical protein [Labilithrix sp.]